MSDLPQGVGWWEASNDKWYPPEKHPDYRPPAPVPEPAQPATPVPEPSQPATPPASVRPPEVPVDRPPNDASPSPGRRRFRLWPILAGLALLILLAAGITLIAGGDDADEANEDVLPAADSRLDGLREVQSVELHPDWRPRALRTPALAVSVRAENRSDLAEFTPTLAMVCAGDGEEGDWFLGSTYEPSVPLPAQSSAQGVIDLGVPQDREQVASCPGPMVVVKPGSSFVVEGEDVTGAVITDGLPPFDAAR
jgi:hypothetical protein